MGAGMDNLDRLERFALVLVARLGPWLSPIPPAYFIAKAAEKHLEAGRWIAVVMAVVVEVVGIATIHTALTAYTWNREKRQKDPAAPLNLGIILSVSYLVIGILLAVLLELDPKRLAPVAIGAFFVLAAIAYLTLAMMADQTKREAETAEARAQEKAEREGKRNKRNTGTEPEQAAIRPVLLPVITGTLPEVTTATRDQAEVILTERPDIPGAELGRLLGKSDSLGRRLKREFAVSRNGNGTGK